eukprot:5585921-Prymnesium_polylepis.1
MHRPGARQDMRAQTQDANGPEWTKAPWPTWATAEMQACCRAEMRTWRGSMCSLGMSHVAGRAARAEPHPPRPITRRAPHRRHRSSSLARLASPLAHAAPRRRRRRRCARMRAYSSSPSRHSSCCAIVWSASASAMVSSTSCT